MVRVVILSLAIIIGLGIVIPMATDYAGAKSATQNKSKKKQKKTRLYSKSWWKSYRAKKKSNQALAARRKALRLKQLRHQQDFELNGGKWVIVTTWNGGEWVSRNQWIAGTSATPTIPPPGEGIEKIWKNTQVLQEKAQVKPAAAANNLNTGSAVVTVVSPVMGQDNDNLRSKTLGGVPVSNLRRAVIDQMIKENGWVINDYQKEVAGRKVFVVLAQSQNNSGQTQSRVFYFTPSEGRIYSIATSAPGTDSEKLAQESERIVNSMVQSGKTLQAELR